MHQIFHDTKRNVLLILKFKNGSSNIGFMVDNEDIYPEIVRVSLTECAHLRALNPKMQIIMTIRTPKIAYMSGMHQIIGQHDVIAKLNAKDKKSHSSSNNSPRWDGGHTSYVTAYSKQLRKYVQNWETKLPDYDFLDSHCAHGLILTLCLLVGAGSEFVKVIPLTAWADYLITHYPKNKKHWENNHSDKSMTEAATTNKQRNTSHRAFNNIIIKPQEGSDSPYTWEKWMAIETDNFNSIMKFLEDGKTTHLKRALNKLAAAEIYWQSPARIDAGEFDTPWSILTHSIKLSGMEHIPDAILMLYHQQMEENNIT